MPQIEGTAQFSYAGTPTNGTSEVQTITVSGSPSGGTFRLSFEGFNTSDLAYNISSANLQIALRLLASIGSGGCSVVGDAPHVVTFTGNLGKLDVTTLFALQNNALTGGTAPSVGIVQTTPGVSATARGAATGAILVDTTTGTQYTNTGTPNAPTWTGIGAQGGGDVVGPASVTDSYLAVFDGTTGKLLKSGGAVPAVAIPLAYLDTDAALTANSDVKVASQKAGKAYTDGKVNITAGRIVQGNGSSGLTSADSLKIASGTLVAPAPDAVLADGSLPASCFAVYLNEAGNVLTFKVKYAGGTVKTGTVALT